MRFFAWILGLGVGTGLIRYLNNPVSDPYSLQFDRARSDCEVLFVGPSYVATTIKADVVDAEARRLGHPIKSCIFGRNNLKGYEQYHEIDRILDESWPRLELVFIDITLGGDLGYRPTNRFTRRIIEFHTWPVFGWYFKYWDSQRVKPHTHAFWLADHTLHFFANALVVGQGAEHLSARAKALEPELKKRAQEGDRSAEPTPTEKRKKREDDRYKRKRAKLLRSNRRTHHPWVPTDELKELLEQEVELVAQHGFRAECLHAPSWAATDLPERLEGTDLVLHDFADPDRYPQLYSTDKHKRDGHLTLAGKKLYSKLLGRLAVERLEGKYESRLSSTRNRHRQK